EWCAKAGVMVRPTDAIASSPAIIEPLVGCMFMLCSPASLLKNVEDVLGKSNLRLIPAGFEILFPVLGPRAAIVVDIAGISLGQLRRATVGVPQIAQTLDVGVPLGGILRRRSPNITIRRVQRLDECLGIVKYRLMIQ